MMRGILDRFVSHGQPLSKMEYAFLETWLDASKLDSVSFKMVNEPNHKNNGDQVSLT